ncbi:hypothetical protein WICMUC_003815 [Wickerhamomyces mucosus]|uniref:BZIP domain-containing protein n=1 Tax=Wickerhamomyces mucosus TaxID=1378264 RepID=A0A9P8PKW0_9ASCO|nr:hypothetical protein WICMUC_003815 [Wickerhamomyces mucosus]
MNDQNNTHSHDNHSNITPAALLEQLVYVDTFMPEIDDPSQLDERLTAELSAFADDSFIFPDEEKPQNNGNQSNGNNNNNSNSHDHISHSNIKHEEGFNLNSLSNGSNNNSHNNNNSQNKYNSLHTPQLNNNGISNILSPLNTITPSSASGNNPDLLSSLPKVPVPPGAHSSLIAAGLSETQIDALAALIAQHQSNGTTSNSSQNNNNNTSQAQVANPLLGLNLHQTSQSQQSPANQVSTSLNFLSNVSSPSSPSSSSTSLQRRDSLKVELTGDADLDKRRRNTAASARFRIKKKLKEQQLERSVRELNELTITLEKKIQTLEMENKLLRNLVVEKGEQKNNDEVEMLRQRARQSSGNGF